MNYQDYLIGRNLCGMLTTKTSAVNEACDEQFDHCGAINDWINEAISTRQALHFVEPTARIADKWAFPVNHPEAICLEELADNLTRDQPLMYTQADGKGNHDQALFVLIDCSLLQKSALLGLEAPKMIKRISRGHGVAQMKRASEIGDWIAWAKAVKAARWKGQKMMIKVVSPVI